MPNRTTVGIVCVCLIAGSARIMNAQTMTGSFDELTKKLKAGQAISVTDDAGRRIDGKLLDLSASSIRVLSGSSQESLTQDKVRQIAKRRHFAGRGAGFGLLSGALLGLLAVASGDCDAEDCDAFALGGALALGGIGAGIGAAVGAGITRDQVIYRAPAADSGKKVVLAPMVSRHGTGLTATVRF